jgi:hypothetical protein
MCSTCETKTVADMRCSSFTVRIWSDGLATARTLRFGGSSKGRTDSASIFARCERQHETIPGEDAPESSRLLIDLAVEQLPKQERFCFFLRTIAGDTGQGER